MANRIGPSRAQRVGDVSTSTHSSTTTTTRTRNPQSRDTFSRLSTDVTAGRLPAADAQVLASAAGQLGVIGEAEALRGAHLAEKLEPADRTTFQRLVDEASSNTARAFLYKALAAGHSLPEVQAFAAQISGWKDDQLVATLSLADDLGGAPGAVQNGIKQQFDASCVATTAQALRGEVDPIYALAVRTQNTNINQVDDADAFAKNAALATEQKHLLEDLGGGRATSRNDTVNAAGVSRTNLPLVYDAMTAYTGFTYANVFTDDVTNPAQTKALLDGLAKQLQQGIPTPLSITGDENRGGHAILACAVDGSGPSQRFLIHDPWDGATEWLTRASLEKGTFKVAGWNRLRGYEAATPAGLTN
jgi:hypothetical protein